MHSLAQSPQDLIVSGTIIDTHRCTPLNPVRLINEDEPSNGIISAVC